MGTRITSSLSSLLVVVSVAIVPRARAYEFMRPVHPHEFLIGTLKDRGYRVRTARVVAFNRFALVRDFPYLAGWSDARIEAWILDVAAYVNEHQLTLTGIRNAAIDHDPQDRVDLFVAPGTGRGCDRWVDGGVVNLKATGNSSWNREHVRALEAVALRGPNGLAEAQKLDHRSGLEDFPTSVAEYVRHFELQEDYDRRAARGAPSKETVEAYFVVDLGFDVLESGWSPRAFVLGRQAHFGRTGRNLPLPNEIYADHGAYQETYSGARIDLGGARTDGEAIEHYHAQVARLGLAAVPEFIRREVRHIGRTPVVRPVAEVPTAKLLRVLRGDRSRLERTPVPEVVGRNRPVGETWVVDDARVAALKYRLMRIDADELYPALESLSDAELTNLFGLSSHTFQMPLPRAVYAYGFTSDAFTVRTAALRAAARVFDRFPDLIELATRMAFAHAADEDPDDGFTELEILVDQGFDLPGYADFAMEVVRAGPIQAKRLLLVKFRGGAGPADLRARVVAWITDHERDRDLIAEAELVFGRTLRPRCGERLW